MKRIIIALMLASFTFGVSNSQLKKVALISVYGDRNLSDNPLETKLYEGMMKDSSFNLTPIVFKFDENLRDNLLPQFPVPFLEKKDVVNADGYKELVQLTHYSHGTKLQSYYTTSAEDYIPIGVSGDKQAIKKAFELYPDIDGVMIAYINFNIYDGAGIGGFSKKKVYAYVNMKIFDKDANLLFKLKERASSKKGVASFAGFIPETSKVLPVIEDAADNLFSDMEKKLPKSLKKMAKKLSK